jgi:hypothetical protein
MLQYILESFKLGMSSPWQRQKLYAETCRSGGKNGASSTLEMKNQRTFSNSSGHTSHFHHDSNKYPVNTAHAPRVFRFIDTRSWTDSGHWLFSHISRPITIDDNIYSRNTDWSVCFCYCINFHIDICALLGYYAESNCNPLLTFRDKISIPSSRVKKYKKISWSLKMEPIRCPETSIKDYH